VQRAHQISGLFLMILAIFTGVISIQLGVGGLDLMGTGFMPLLASILLFALSLTDLMSSLVKGRAGKRDKKGPTLGELTKPAVLIGALIVYVYFLKSVGFPIMTFLLVYVLFVMMQPEKWRLDLFYAALVSAATFLFFDVVLKVRLPAGILVDLMR
jgi:putative tricarboxylic transport membrane protein